MTRPVYTICGWTEDESGDYVTCDEDGNPCDEPLYTLDVLDSAMDMQRQQVSYACAVVAQQVESFGMKPVTVPITYYKDQAMYDEYGRDPGPFGQANANARAVATALEQRGIKVTFNYPLDGAIRTEGSRY